MLNLILTVILEAGASAAAEDEHENAIQLPGALRAAWALLVGSRRSLRALVGRRPKPLQCWPVSQQAYLSICWHKLACASMR